MAWTNWTWCNDEIIINITVTIKQITLIRVRHDTDSVITGYALWSYALIEPLE